MWLLFVVLLFVGVVLFVLVCLGGCIFVVCFGVGFFVFCVCVCMCMCMYARALVCICSPWLFLHEFN